jgi:O-antigen/teichoic acid export membrane protein
MLGRHRWTVAGRRAVAGVGLYGVANAFDAAVGLALIPMITRAVSMEVFAQKTLLLSAAGIALVVIDLGMGKAVVRELTTKESAEERERTIASALWFRLLTSFGVGLISFATSHFVAEPLSGALRIGAFAIAAMGMMGGFQDVLRGLQRHETAAAALVIKSFAWAGAVLHLVVLGNGGLRGLVLAYLIAFSLGDAFCVARLGARALLRWPDRARIKRMLGFGFPIAGYLVIRTIGGLDRYLVRFRSSTEATAIYQVASIPAAAMELAERTLVQPSEPYLYSVAPELREQALARVVRLTTFALAAIAIPITMMGPEMIALLAPPSYASALGALPCFMFAALTRTVTHVVAIGAALTGKTRIWTIAAAIEIVLAAASMFVLLPTTGVAGATIARFGASMVSLITAYVLLRKVWNVQLAIGTICMYLVASAAILSACSTDLFGLLAPLPVRIGVGVALVGAGYLLVARQSTSSPGSPRSS